MLGNQQRCVVRQHDAAGADPDMAGAGRDMGQCHRGRGAGDPGQVVVLRHPEAAIAEGFDVPRQVERVAQRLAGIAAFNDRGEVENRERDHMMRIASDGADGKPLGTVRDAIRLCKILVKMKQNNCKVFALADGARQEFNTLRYVAGKRCISFLLPSRLGWHIGASRDAY